MAKTVRVNDDTHKALKQLKARRRSASIDQVIREMIRSFTGKSVEQVRSDSKVDELTRYLKA